MKRRKRLPRAVVASVMYISSAIIIVPLLVMIFGSLKTSGEAMGFNVLPPKKPIFSNYSFVIERGGILRAMFNSVLITSVATVLTIGSAALCSFYISRSSTRAARITDWWFAAGLIAPFQIITTFGLLQILGLFGSYQGVILVFAAGQMPWAVYMFAQFIKTVPRELDEAAYIDGANPLMMFLRVIFPLLKPITATTTILVAIGIWNDFMIPLYFFNSSKKWTMPLTVYNFYGQYYSDWNYVFADLVLTVLPMALLYLIFQKYIISGLVSGAVKG